ncbi:hypothetical protein Asi03nite_21760 [Actinoplanes siamensis]|uniref:Uncharacterized protein n=1 Tax=Actinoplanes siamensis TaxID=1223317 RepID=A0A919N5A1_9ACTN|nr:hypothetical protein Asi03nite_21760 [Actinoplanes siamensis]
MRVLGAFTGLPCIARSLGLPGIPAYHVSVAVSLSLFMTGFVAVSRRVSDVGAFCTYLAVG